MPTPPQDREFDVVVYGATGYTGRLVAQYLGGKASQQPGTVGAWVMAARSEEKLRAVREEIGVADDTPLMVADAEDPASLAEMASRTRVVLTTVGPYQRYGEPLVKACIEAGTDYVDLCGEPAWMAEMIERHGAAAKESGARIVFSCGFDSIPSDLGVFVLQEAARQRFGSPLDHVALRVRKMKGTFSGGTAASFQETMKAAMKDPAVIGRLKDPFALCEGWKGAEQPSMTKVRHDDEAGVWLAPFMMAPINTKIVHRSNHLQGHPYGEGFRYEEMVATTAGEAGKAIADAITGDDSLSPDKAPKPGEGPSPEERESGMFDLLLSGRTADGQALSAVVTGDKDPGYGSTSKMIAQAALCLASGETKAAGGFHTPASAMGTALAERLRRHAGLTFEVQG
jgi:short subunit dehydrogenase-like uncharacterized protein